MHGLDKQGKVSGCVADMLVYAPVWTVPLAFFSVGMPLANRPPSPGAAGPGTGGAAPPAAEGRPAPGGRGALAIGGPPPPPPDSLPRTKSEPTAEEKKKTGWLSQTHRR
jgi:hypothetical protein